MNELLDSDYHHIFHKSKKHKRSKIITIFIIIIFGLLTYIFNHIFISFIFFISGITLIIFALISFKDKILVKMSNNGLLIKGQKFIYWNEIKSFTITKEYSLIYYLLGENTIMKIYFKNRKPKSTYIDISGINDRKTLIALTKYYIEKDNL